MVDCLALFVVCCLLSLFVVVRRALFVVCCLLCFVRGVVCVVCCLLVFVVA